MSTVPPIIEDLIRQLDEKNSDTVAYTLERIAEAIGTALSRYNGRKARKRA